MSEPVFGSVGAELVPLDAPAAHQPTRQFGVLIDGQPSGRVLASSVPGRMSVAVVDVPAEARTVQRRALLSAVLAHARAEGVPEVVLVADTDLLLRYDARALGFRGGLRQNLVWDGPASRVGVAPDLQDRFLAELRSLLPDVSVAVAHRSGWMRSIARSASGERAEVVSLDAQHRLDDHPLRVLAPLAADLMPEGVALSVDTALAIRRRFRPTVDRVRLMMDHSLRLLVDGICAGEATQSRDIHITPAYALVGEMEALNAQLAARQRRTGTGSPSFRGTGPFTRVEAVVAHEFGHQIDFDLEGSRYRDTLELHRAVGAYFGVESLEQVIKGKEPKAPHEWRLAFARLAEEVSPYATTNPHEAKAELFSLWWCTPTSPPPVAEVYGEILRRFFPNADLRR
ncbi:MAG TPA: hypothetical protein VHT30_03720 [Acidimicrobiales bacterium]|jgi:hypothetical protein|nr:hypothetical protein [Acidimicrobiales bacterium]